MIMMHSVTGLRDFSITAVDGELGRITDVFFDDKEWTIRYLVVDTGNWLTGRSVLISPAAVTGTYWEKKSVMVDLSKEQVRNSPDVDTAKPVSRQHEVEFYDYYGYPYYWSGPYLWGYAAIPADIGNKRIQEPASQGTIERIEQERVREEDPHLRSCAEVVDYAIGATDDKIGHVDDFLFDEENWRIDMLVIDTRNWWPGKHVLISPSRITRVDWESQMVEVNVTREQIEGSPEYDPSKPPPRLSEHALYRHGNGGMSH